MKISPEMKAVLKKYFEIKKEIARQENHECDPGDIGWVDEALFQRLGEARDEFARLIQPDDYMSAFNEIAHLKEQIGELILENIVLKSAVSNLGGDPVFIGNVNNEGRAQ